MHKFRQLFCSHRYRSLGSYQLEQKGERQSYHRIQCVHCGRTRQVASEDWHFRKFKRAL